jgi:hypothetical protein
LEESNGGGKNPMVIRGWVATQVNRKSTLRCPISATYYAQDWLVKSFLAPHCHCNNPTVARTDAWSRSQRR